MKYIEKGVCRDGVLSHMWEVTDSFQDHEHAGVLHYNAYKNTLLLILHYTSPWYVHIWQNAVQIVIRVIRSTQYQAEANPNLDISNT